MNWAQVDMEERGFIFQSRSQFKVKVTKKLFSKKVKLGTSTGDRESQSEYKVALG